MGVGIIPTAQFQPTTRVRSFKMLNALDGLVVAVHRIGHQGRRIWAY